MEVTPDARNGPRTGRRATNLRRFSILRSHCRCRTTRPTSSRRSATCRNTGCAGLPDVLTDAEVDFPAGEARPARRPPSGPLGDLAPLNATGPKQLVSNMQNKGREILALVERSEVDELVGSMLGKYFLISSINGGIFPRQDHRATATASRPGQRSRDRGLPGALQSLLAARRLHAGPGRHLGGAG